jgi:hypothetical protein
MGYRALLKNYIRHLVRVAGTSFIDEQSEAGVLGKRERQKQAELGRTPGEPPRYPGR